MIIKCSQCKEEYPLSDASSIPRGVDYISCNQCPSCNNDKSEYVEKYIYKQKQDKTTYTTNNNQIELGL